jgi:competence protein ComEC
MLLPVTLAFLAGLVGGSLLPYVPFSLLFLLILTGAVLAIAEQRNCVTVFLGTILFGSLLAGILYWTFYAWMTSDPHLADQAGDHAIRIVGTLVEPVRLAPGHAALVLSVSHLGDRAESRPVRGQIRVTWRDPDRGFGQGDLVELTARIRPPTGTRNPGGFDYAAYLHRRSIDAVASVSGHDQVRLLSTAPLLSWWTPWRLIDDWRDRIRQAAAQTLNGSALGVYLAIIIGQPGYLTPEVRDAFMATGTVHILSISGSHLGLIALLSFFSIRGLCRHLSPGWLQALSRRITPTRLAAAITILPVTFYTLLAGAEVATVRSLVMILVFLLAVWLGREEDLLIALAGAALLILLHDPRALFDLSFQLSFCSVLAIALVLRRHSREDDGQHAQTIRERGQHWLHAYLWITGGVTIATTPLVAYHFNQIAWLGIFANLLVLPLAGLVLVPLGLGSAIWVLMTGQDRLPLATLNQAGLDSMVAAVRLLAKIPGAEWHVASPAILAIAVFYAMCYLLIRPEGWRSIRWLCGCGVVILLGWWIWSPRAAPDGETLRVTFLDVGQGDACVIELPDGQTVLIDGGAAYDTLDMGRAVVGPYLWDRGIRRLDHVIGTHPQLDHVGGLAWVLRSFEVGHYWGNGIARTDAFYQRLHEAVQERGLTELIAQERRAIISTGPCRLVVLNPPAPAVSRPRGQFHAGKSPVTASGSVLNNASVVTRLDCGPHSFLFTADIEMEALARLRATGDSADIRVLKVPHHGARSSLDPQWIAQVQPEVAVISVGGHNAYGHPAQTVLAAYEAHHARLLRTDRQGAVQVSGALSSWSMQVRAAQDGSPQPVRFGPSLPAAERRNLLKLWTLWTEIS